MRSFLWVVIGMVCGLAGIGRAQPRQVDLPAVPAFQVPASRPGTHDPSALLANGKAALGSKVKVQGYVVWIYDCARDAMRVGESRAHFRASIAKDPALCEPAKLALGTRKDTPREQALTVADVPATPAIKFGDYVEITGDFALASPHQDHAPGGLVVFAAVEQAPPPAAPPAMVEVDHGAARAAAAALTRTLAAAPSDPKPWIALVELYRQWHYTDQALAVAAQATTYANHTDVWLAAALANLDAHKLTPALAALGKALDLDAHNTRARFQRGMLYAQMHDRARAQPDLEAVVAANPDADTVRDAQHRLHLYADGR